MIRRATAADALHVATLGHKFIQAADMPAATVEMCLDFCSTLIGSPSAGVFVSPGGVIAGVIGPLYYRPDYLQAIELFWWSEDRTGMQLLAAFEDWAVAEGASDINMSSLEHYSPPHVDVVLKKRGYLPRDKTFRKVLK